VEAGGELGLPWPADVAGSRSSTDRGPGRECHFGPVAVVTITARRCRQHHSAAAALAAPDQLATAAPTSERP